MGDLVFVAAGRDHLLGSAPLSRSDSGNAWGKRCSNCSKYAICPTTVDGVQFDAPLRALQDCYDFFERNPDVLVAEIESAIERHGEPQEVKKRNRIAR